jgi:hypothetical protein
LKLAKVTSIKRHLMRVLTGTQRPLSQQSRSRAHYNAERSHDHHGEFLNGLLAGSGPNEARWSTKRRIEPRPTAEAEGPGCLVQNGHGDVMWRSLSHRDANRLLRLR